MTHDLEEIDRRVAELTAKKWFVSQIAAELGVHRQVVYRSRKRIGAETRAPRPAVDVAGIRTEFIALHCSGYTDRGIADRLKISRETAGRIRNAFNLPPNSRYKHDRELIERMFNDGASDARIAEALDTTVDSAQRARQRMGLYRKTNPRIPQEKLDEIEALLADGASGREAARSTGVGYATVARRFPGRGWTREQINEYVSVRKLAEKVGV